MKPISIWRYIYFGTALRYLQDVKAGLPIHKESFILENLDYFLSDLDEFDLTVTKRTLSIENLIKLRNKLNRSNQNSNLTEEDAKTLNDLMSDVRKTLHAESKGNIAYIVTEKRMDINKLMNNPEKLFPEGVFETLPYFAQYDIIEAGKCIAFELPTAAAFHLLRGTEAVLKDFYCSIVKRNRCKLLWGPMVTSLRSRRKGRPPEVLLNNLDNIRNSFRNPTQHPEKCYDINEAQDLFSLCIDVMNRMVAF